MRFRLWLHIMFGCQRCRQACYGEATADVACPWGYAYMRKHQMIEVWERHV